MLSDWYTRDDIRAVDAKFEAQKIAFAPLAFQAARALRGTGVLELLSGAGESGVTKEAIARELSLSEYAAGVLLEMGLSMGILKLRPDSSPWRYLLGKIGFFLCHDAMTNANMDFANDVCYQGAFHLPEALSSGKPEGLKVFGDWPTIYRGLTSLPERARKSWFAFDHFYSDGAFPQALDIVFSRPRRHLLDIGGNTARWALACAGRDPGVRVTIVDLPGQSALALRNIAAAGMSGRISVREADVLDPSSALPSGADAVWMSQFLDCFSLEEVTSILSKVASAVDAECDVFVLEPLWDKQRFPAAAYSLHATSLYFAAMANGNSKMYAAAELERAVCRAGFTMKAESHTLGPNDYSLLRFRKTR
ncbi:MAG: class I SAM-dependent methyltransferase [Spirochaetales bacterium]|nr:class I SAM-dependent methyltransferase [Spirochaetales bacterium]